MSYVGQEKATKIDNINVSEIVKHLEVAKTNLESARTHLSQHNANSEMGTEYWRTNYDEIHKLYCRVSDRLRSYENLEYRGR